MQSINQTQTIVNSSKKNNNIKGIGNTLKNKVTYEIIKDIIEIVEDYTANPEITNDIIYQLHEQELYNDKTATINIFNNPDYTEETAEIERVFSELYTQEITEGLEETTITPEQYKEFITTLIITDLDQYLTIEIQQEGNNIIFKDEETARTEINYYILNDIKTLTAGFKDYLYNIFIEDEEVQQEITNFIYMNSYYNE